MKYLVTHFYSNAEVPFLKLNYLEGKNHIDKFIFVEFNYTKIGTPKEYVNIDKKDIFTEDDFKQIMYFKVDLTDKVLDANNDTTEARTVMAIHNEPLFRSYFKNLVDFKDDDIVISVDADEIVYEQAYDHIFKEMQTNDILLLKMYMFYYRLDHLSNELWTSPIAMRYSVGRDIYDIRSDGNKTKYPQWRKCSMTKDSKITSIYTGCHFSWCMTIEDMLNKLDCHGCGVTMKYKKLSNKEILEEMITNKKFYMKDKANFNLIKISIKSDIYPKQIYKMLDSFSNLYH